VLVNGPIPAGKVIDHIDGDPSNNRIENLRLVFEADNHRNAARNKRNWSGVMGVQWEARDFYWQVFIGGDYVGRSRDFTAACKMRKEAESAKNFHPNHGRSAIERSERPVENAGVEGAA
jgi:HNH endonuclease